MTRRVALLLALGAALARPAAADDHRDGDHDDDHRRVERRVERDGEVNQDSARDALAKGAIKPLPDVLKAGEAAMPGQVVGVKLKRKKGRLVYELKILAAQGRLREVYIDAANLEIIRIE